MNGVQMRLSPSISTALIELTNKDNNNQMKFYVVVIQVIIVNSLKINSIIKNIIMEIMNSIYIQREVMKLFKLITRIR